MKRLVLAVIVLLAIFSATFLGVKGSLSPEITSTGTPIFARTSFDFLWASTDF